MTSLSDIFGEWRKCKRCGLAATRNKVVIASPWIVEPSEDAPLLLLVGEAPGRVEDERGEAFVGPSGRILRQDMLPDFGVCLGMITNTIGCRPPGNRNPTADEIEACAPRLEALVDVLDPDGLILIGDVSAGTQGKWRERFNRNNTVKVVHPAALMRHGHPSAYTRQRIKTEAGKVKRLLARLGYHEPTSKCEHDYMDAGYWALPGNKREPFRACRLCGILES